MRMHGIVDRKVLCTAIRCLFALWLTGLPGVAAAQPAAWEDRAFLSVNTMLTLTSNPFDDRGAPVIYAERAVLTTTHPGSGGLSVEPTGGVRVWRNLGIGATVSHRSTSETATVRALVPHPVLFNQPRLAAKDGSFERAATAVHAHAILMVPVTPRLDVAILAGPSYVSLRQDILRTVQVAEAGPPFTTVAVADVAALTREVNTIAFNGGLDVTWFLTPLSGIGVTARYVRGFARTTLTDGTPIDLRVGGLQLGVGARLRFR